MAETSKLRELIEEFRTVVVGRSNIVDAVVPPAIFLVLNALAGLQIATGAHLPSPWRSPCFVWSEVSHWPAVWAAWVLSPWPSWRRG